MAVTIRTLAGSTSAVALALALAACTSEATPERPEQPESQEVVRPPLVQEDLAAVMGDQQSRTNDARDRADAPDYDPKGWRKSAAGWLLEVEQAGTRFSRLSDYPNDTGRVTGRSGDVYPVTSTGDPVFAVVTNGANTTAPGPDTRQVQVFARRTEDAPWLSEVAVTVPDRQLPGPTEARDLTEDDWTQAADAAAAYTRYLETGRAPGLDDRRARVTARKELLDEDEEDDAELASITIEAKPYGGNTTGEDGVWVAPTAKGLLVVVTLRTETTLTAAEGSRYRWNDPYDDFWGGGELTDVIRRADLVGAVLHVTDGDPQLLGDRVEITAAR
ncbi:hypothetical protein GCM10009623_24060 [Nocardioides aestuarii]|uniref:Lipoprotein n=1 Tax=Nocardioides aestuarii TaxID=252231 RepID=A0ABW4TNP2_9ACTN